MSPHDVELDATVTEGAGESKPVDRAFSLVVVSGPDKGRRLEVESMGASRLFIGKSEVCELRLSDQQISRRHAGVDYLGRFLRLTDMGSTNGTYIDRVRVMQALLTGGELVRLGSTVLRVDERPLDQPSHSPEESTSFGRLLGASRAMVSLYPLLERLAQSKVSVVIEGDTGTGKEALAEALHERGPRAGKPFVIFDCTSVPPSLIESELFGHERGAFTGAVAARRGVFEQAHGGTLFIDEIGDLDLGLQPKLLRALERSEIRRVGGDRWLPVDVRILSATRRDLDREVEDGRFREDLFHRLAVARVELPPLRDRTGDVRLLAKHFWNELGGPPGALSDDLLRRWEASAWPGNVRELRHAVARHIAVGDLPPRAPPAPEVVEGEPSGWAVVLQEIFACNLPFPRARDRILETFTEHYVAHVLRQHDGNVARAAASSGIGRRYFEKLRARKAERTSG
jgi:DNA-binding NtrC family response regulator